MVPAPWRFVTGGLASANPRCECGAAPASYRTPTGATLWNGPLLQTTPRVSYAARPPGRPEILWGSFTACLAISERKMTLKYRKLHLDATPPQRATKGAGGYDLSPLMDRYIAPSEQVLIETGLAIALPAGYTGIMTQRSSMRKRGLHVEGLIDADYVGEVFISARNEGSTGLWVEAGQRIAQLVVVPVYQEPVEAVEELVSTERGTGGFGSTGR